MKITTKISISIFAVAIGSICISEYSTPAIGFSGGASIVSAGDPASGNKTCAASGCHLGTPIVEADMITSTIPITGYIADTTYTISATVTRFGHSKFGFEVSPQNSNGDLMGTLTATNINTQLVSSDKYITHTSTGTSGTDTRTWTFDWTAPSTGSGDVTFYGAFNATNSNGQTSGDTILTSTTVVSEDMSTPTSISEVASENQITVYPNPVVDNFYVTSSTAIVSMNIVDLSGKVLKSESTISNGQAINISSFDAGIYLLQITTESGELVKKIVKQ